MPRVLLGIAGIVGFLMVAGGAFGAHALKSQVTAGRMTEAMLANFETGTRYGLVHAAALLAIALSNRADLSVAGWAFVAGIAVFTGSLWAMALTNATKLGAITPLGGLAFLVGWAALAIAAARG